MGAVAAASHDLLREAFASLARSLKRIAIYRHAREQYASFIEPALAALRDVLEREGSFTVEVQTSSLSLEGTPVHTEPPREWGLCFRLHRDGVRTLTFRRGLTLEELMLLCQVAIFDPQSGPGPGREDAVTELWKADLTSISYTAISGYRMEHGELDAQRVVEAVGRLAARARPALLGGAAQVSEFADATAFDERRRLLSEEELAAMDALGWSELARRAALTLLRIVEEGFAGRDLDALEESFWRLLDELIDRGEAAALVKALEGLKRMGGSHAAEFRAAVGRRLGDPARLLRLAELSGRNEAALQGALPLWLALLQRDGGGVLLEVLGQAPPAAQPALARAAIERAEHALDRLATLLASGPPGAVAALLAALEPLAPATRAELSTPALGHPSARVRIAAVAAVGGDHEAAVRELGRLLQGPEASVRAAAAQALAGCSGAAERAAGLLVAAIERPGSAAPDREEVALLHRCLGRLGSAGGFGFLSDRLQVTRGLFKKKPAEAERLLAVIGLAEEATLRSLRALEAAASPESGQPAPVAAAARAAVQRLKALSGKERLR